MAVLQCRTHRRAFTLYPLGHLLYGRRAIAPVGLDGELLRATDGEQVGGKRPPAWSTTLFGSAFAAIHKPTIKLTEPRWWATEAPERLAQGWSTSCSGLDTVLTPSRDRCSGRRRRRVHGGDVLGYLRGTLRLGFGLSRWEDGAWTTADPIACLDAWAVQPWFTEPMSGAGSALAV